MPVAARRSSQHTFGEADHDADTRPASALFSPLAAAAFAATPAAAGTDANAEARGIIADLQRVVTPRGVEESFKARRGGIEQMEEPGKVLVALVTQVLPLAKETQQGANESRRLASRRAEYVVRHDPRANARRPSK